MRVTVDTELSLREGMSISQNTFSIILTKTSAAGRLVDDLTCSKSSKSTYLDWKTNGYNLWYKLVGELLLYLRYLQPGLPHRASQQKLFSLTRLYRTSSYRTINACFISWQPKHSNH